MKKFLVAYRIRYRSPDGNIRDIIEADEFRNISDEMAEMKDLFILGFCDEKKKELDIIKFPPGMSVENVKVLAITEI